ncbi:MAG: hypothetical protein ACTSSP_06155 [Candidatus Asgardarchaeia archaeon]
MKKNKKLRKVLGKYNYWRRIFGLSFRLRRKPFGASACQVACHSDPCEADPTCDFD